MEQSDIQKLFIGFAAPLFGFAALGGRKKSVEELARNLWVAMLAGNEAEEQMWTSLADADADLCDTVKRCYFEEMKPLVSKEQLAALRQRYWDSEGTA
jgi:hypothetical protein